MAGKKPVVMTEAKIRKLKEEITRNTITLFIACAMDEFGWTDEQVGDFAARLHRYQSAVEDAHLISYKKIAEIIEKEMSVKIEW